MAHPAIQPSQIRIAARDVAAAVGGGNIPYAVVGGAACLMLGSPRLTQDIDVVVPANSTKPSRSLLKATGHFTIDPRTQHTTHTATHAEVEILTPPNLFRGEFTAHTDTLTVDGVRVLHPVLLLNAKCGSFLGRANEAKKRTDATDIVFLLRWHAKAKTRITANMVPNAPPEFVEYISGQGLVPMAEWVAAGYRNVKGSGKGWPL